MVYICHVTLVSCWTFIIAGMASIIAVSRIVGSAGDMFIKGKVGLCMRDLVLLQDPHYNPNTLVYLEQGLHAPVTENLINFIYEIRSNNA